MDKAFFDIQIGNNLGRFVSRSVNRGHCVVSFSDGAESRLKGEKVPFVKIGPYFEVNELDVIWRFSDCYYNAQSSSESMICNNGILNVSESARNYKRN